MTIGRSLCLLIGFCCLFAGCNSNEAAPASTASPSKENAPQTTPDEASGMDSQSAEDSPAPASVNDPAANVDEPDESGAPAADDQATNQPTSAEQAVAEAQELLNAGKLKEAVEVVRAALKNNPDDAMLLVAGAVAAEGAGISSFQQGDSESAYPLAVEAAEYAERFLKVSQGATPPILQQQLGTIFYNTACASAVQGETQTALDKLDKAYEYGFRDANQLQTDPDMDSLREEERFKEMVKKMQGGEADREAGGGIES